MAELTYKQIINRQKDINDEIERLNNKAEERGELSEEDEKFFDELHDEFNSLDRDRKAKEREQKTLDIRRSLVHVAGERGTVEAGVSRYSTDDFDSDPLGEPDSVEERRFQNPWDLSEMRTFNRSAEQVGTELRARALSAIERMHGMNDRRRAAATSILEQWDSQDGSLSKLALVSSHPDYMRAFAKAASGNDRNFTEPERQAVERVRDVQRAMSLTDTAGGFLVPFQLDPTVIITSDGSLNEIRMAARQVVATSDVWNGVSSGAVTWSWDAEEAQVGDDATTFAQPTVPIYKAAGFVPISIEALQDEQNVTSEVGRLLAFGKDDLEAAAFATGGGGTEPTGIVTALAASAGGASIVASVTSDTFAVADVYALDDDLPARYRRRASWLANRSIYNDIRQFGTSDGHALWERIGNDVPNQLLGRPAYESEDMDGVINALADNYVAVFGDLQNYVIADRIGFTVEFIPHLMGANQRPTGQRGWYAYYRVGADSVNDAGMRVLNVT